MTTQIAQPTARPVPWGWFVMLILLLAWGDALGRHDCAVPLAVFGRLHHALDDQMFDRGSVAAAFGQASVDLRRAELTPDGAVLRASAAFGRVDVRVPEGWSVETRGVGILGRYRDLTRRQTGGPVLRVEGMALFGEVRVGN